MLSIVPRGPECLDSWNNEDQGMSLEFANVSVPAPLPRFPCANARRTNKVKTADGRWVACSDNGWNTVAAELAGLCAHLD
jgi:hypothetical protein